MARWQHQNVRITIRLDDRLLREAKLSAARTGRSLNEFIEDAVRSAVLDDRQAARDAPIIPVFRGGRGLHAGVDLDSKTALLEIMGEDQR